MLDLGMSDGRSGTIVRWKDEKRVKWRTVNKTAVGMLDCKLNCNRRRASSTSRHFLNCAPDHVCVKIIDRQQSPTHVRSDHHFRRFHHVLDVSPSPFKAFQTKS
jgi:hypothetical protein